MQTNLAYKLEREEKSKCRRHSESYYRRKAKREIIKLALIGMSFVGMYAILVCIMSALNLL